MFNYKPSPTGIPFHSSDAFLKMVLGPYGSGKSTMAAMDILYNAAAQTPAPDGVRYSRVGVLRSTYPELKSTTRKTLLEVLPGKPYGDINLGNPMTGLYKFPLPDGTQVQLELMLIAIRDDLSTDKLKSANLSFAWINEADTVPYEVLIELTGRVGRFPPKDLGGCRWSGILMDFNRPAEGHYLLRLMQNPVLDVKGMTITGEAFTQPPAAFKRETEDGHTYYEVNEDAENLENLTGGSAYYERQIALWLDTGNRNKIDSLFCLLEAPSPAGKPVFSGVFDTSLHVAKGVLDVQPYHPVVVGYDTSGIHPAMVFLQEQNGKWCVLDELYGENVGLESFIEQAAMPLMRSKYATCSLVISCDPANARDGYTGLTPTAHLQAQGLQTFVARANDYRTRIRAVEALLNKNVGGLLISPSCTYTLRAMTSGYRFRKMRIMGSFETTYDTKPEKNDDSHLADALQYAAMCILRREEDLRSVLAPAEQAARHLKRQTLRVVVA